MAADHAITPALSFAIGNDPALPAEIADHLAAVRYLNAERNARILDGIDSVAAVLADHGVDAVFLKGAASLIDALHAAPAAPFAGLGRAPCRESVCQYGKIPVVAVALNNKRSEQQ